MITILTPTYNRAHTLPNLYFSLAQQTTYNFEWLVIDDGSIDNTAALINQYSQESSFPIRYVKQDNGGKHSALNRGFSESSFEWIFIVDSDDTLKNDAIETIAAITSELTHEFNSLCILRSYNDGRVIGNKFPDGMNNYLDRAYKNITGDKADIIRKDSIIDFSFPEYENENFMAESPLYLWLGTRGKTKFVNYKGYLCEYLEGGLTDNSVRNRYRCTNSTLYVYRTQYETYTKPLLKMKAAVNWWRFKLFREADESKYKMPLKYLPLGFCLYTLDKVRSK